MPLANRQRFCRDKDAGIVQSRWVRTAYGAREIEVLGPSLAFAAEKVADAANIFGHEHRTGSTFDGAPVRFDGIVQLLAQTKN